MGDIIFLYVLMAALACCVLPVKTQKHASVLLLLLMMLICGFRAYDVCVDTHNYVDYATSRDVSDYKWGPLWLVLKSISDLFSNKQTAFLLLMAVLNYVPLIYIARKYSNYPSLSVLMFIIPVADYFVQSMNIARQSIAIVFVLVAAVLIENKRKKWALVTIIISFFIHPYTIIAFALLFIDKLKLTKGKVYIMILTSTVIGVIGTLAGIQDFLNVLMLMTEDSSYDLIGRFAKYGDRDVASNFSLIGQLSHILPLAAMCWIGANEKTLTNTYYKLMVLGCIFTNIFVSVIFCERIASTYTIAQFLAVPYIYKTSTHRDRIILILLIIMTSLLFLYNFKAETLLPLWHPYHTIFD